MKIPKKIKVGGHTITVITDKIKPGLCGEWDPDTNTIHISANIAQSQKESTFFHEVLHALNAVLGETHSSHALLDSLSEQLYQVLKDNKLLRG